AGLTAALEAGRSGGRVILVDEQAELGGCLLTAGWNDWVAGAIAELSSMPELRTLTRATAFGVYDQNLVLIVERRSDGQRLWQVRASKIVLATGAHERPPAGRHQPRGGDRRPRRSGRRRHGGRECGLPQIGHHRTTHRESTPPSDRVRPPLRFRRLQSRPTPLQPGTGQTSIRRRPRL